MDFDNTRIDIIISSRAAMGNSKVTGNVDKAEYVFIETIIMDIRRASVLYNIKYLFITCTEQLLFLLSSSFLLSNLYFGAVILFFHFASWCLDISPQKCA